MSDRFKRILKIVGAMSFAWILVWIFSVVFLVDFTPHLTGVRFAHMIEAMKTVRNPLHAWQIIQNNTDTNESRTRSAQSDGPTPANPQLYVTRSTNTASMVDAKTKMTYIKIAKGARVEEYTITHKDGTTIKVYHAQ